MPPETPEDAPGRSPRQAPQAAAEPAESRAELERRLLRAEAELRASGERYRLAMDATNDGIWDWDVETGEVYFSPGYTRMLGWDSAEFRDRVESWTALIHPADLERVLAANQTCIDGPATHFEVEYRLRTRTGEWKWILGRGRRIGPDGGRARRMVGTHVDITALKHAEEMQRTLEAELHQSQKLESLGSLAGGVAHDMNNILAAIHAVTQTLQWRHAGDAGLAQALATIEKASNRGRDLVKSLTNFARKDLRESELLDMNVLLREELEILRRTTLQKVDLELELEEPLPVVLGERGILASALMNLCLNAVDAMPKGGTLTLRTCRPADGQVELEVADSGEGMAPAVLARAMEPFFTTKPAGKGTGLGLAMVYATVKAHGGTVSIQSAAGRGTTVLLRLPAHPDLREAEPAQEPAPSQGSMHILLVDDDDLVRASVPAMVEHFGHRVTTVAGGQQALDLVAGGAAIDLVILDLNMPGMNGAETLDRLRRLAPGLPVLLATGHLDEGTAKVIRQDGHATCLAKPFSMAELDRKFQELQAI